MSESKEDDRDSLLDGPCCFTQLLQTKRHLFKVSIDAGQRTCTFENRVLSKLGEVSGGLNVVCIGACDRPWNQHPDPAERKRDRDNRHRGKSCCDECFDRCLIRPIVTVIGVFMTLLLGLLTTLGFLLAAGVTGLARLPYCLLRNVCCRSCCRSRVRPVESGEYERFRMVFTKSEVGENTAQMTIFHSWQCSQTVFSLPNVTAIDYKRQSVGSKFTPEHTQQAIVRYGGAADGKDYLLFAECLKNGTTKGFERWELPKGYEPDFATAVRLVGEFLQCGAEAQQLAELSRSHADRQTHTSSAASSGKAGKQSQSAPGAGDAAAASSSPAPVLMDDAKSPV